MPAVGTPHVLAPGEKCVYFGSYCQHGEHSACIGSCKTCGSECICPQCAHDRHGDPDAILLAASAGAVSGWSHRSGDRFPREECERIAAQVLAAARERWGALHPAAGAQNADA